MARPSSYTRTTSFTNSFAASPNQTFPGASLDVELNNIKTTLDQLIANDILIQNDDGTLANASVGTHQLSASLQIGFTVPTVWASGVAYTASPASTVFNGNKFYSCLVSNSSSASFAADLAAGKWALIADLSAIPLVTASQIAVTPAGNITQTDVQNALQQLDTLKLQTSTFNSLVASQITDSSADGRALLTSALAAQRNALGGPQIGDIKHTARVLLDALWLWANGAAVSRTTYALLLAAIAPATTGTTNGSTTISAIPVDLTGLGLEGSKIEGTNISAGATISSITSTTIVITGTISDSAAGKALRIFPYGNGDGSTTFNVPKYNGTALVARDNQGGVTASKIIVAAGNRLNTVFGAETQTLSLANLPVFTQTPTFTSTLTYTPGTISTNQSNVVTSGGGASLIGSGGVGVSSGALTTTIPAFTPTGTISAVTFGSATAHNNAQPSTTCNVWIFAGA